MPYRPPPNPFASGGAGNSSKWKPPSKEAAMITPVLKLPSLGASPTKSPIPGSSYTGGAVGGSGGGGYVPPPTTAASIIEMPIRSLTLEPGLKNSSLTARVEAPV